MILLPTTPMTTMRSMRTSAMTTPISSSSLSPSSSALMTLTSQFYPRPFSSSPWSSWLWLYARCTTIFVLLPAFVNGEIRVNKCCGANEQLNDYLRSCIPFESDVIANVTENTTTVFPKADKETTTIETFTATALPMTTVLSTTIEEQITNLPGEVILDGELPFWIDPNLTVLGAHNSLPVAVAAAWAGARATLGRRQCNYSDTYYVHTLRREWYQMLANGSLLLPMWRTYADGRGRTAVQVAFSPDEWCMDRTGSGYFVILACPCKRVTCLNRCCNRNSMYQTQKIRQMISTVCVKVANATGLVKDPVFHSGRDQLNGTNNSDGQGDTSVEDAGGVVYTELFAHEAMCDLADYSKYLLSTNSDEEIKRFWIQRNGSVVIEDFGHGRAFDRHHVCHVEVHTPNGTVVPDVFFCHKHSTRSKPNQENVYYSVLFLLGAFFLLLTLLVHALVPELRRSPHAKALMCHCASLLIVSVTLTVGHLRRTAEQPLCSISAFLTQFFFLCTFFWLNVMCFDLSWTYGAMRRRRLAGVGGGRSRRFLWYSLYAWGIPGLVTAITLFMEYAPAAVVPPDLALLPNIGARRCWFDTKAATFVYYYGPVALLLLVNLALFVFTVVRIRNSQRETTIPRKGSTNARSQRDAISNAPTGLETAATGSGAGNGGVDTGFAESEGADNENVSETAAKKFAATSPAKSAKKNVDRQMLIGFTKLFCLMGVTWVTEIVSWLVDEDSFAFWYVTDAINLLRGVLIFVFFCCKPAALRPLRARLRACAECCCPLALRLSASRKQPRVSISTLESSMSRPDMMTTTASGTASAVGIKEDAL